MKTLFCFLTIISSLANICAAWCNPNDVIENGVTPQDIETIVDTHNKYRAQIMEGRVPGQPIGIGLNRLQWDYSLAQQAQTLASSCELKTQPDAFDPRFPSFSGSRGNLGQSAAMSMSNLMNRGANWAKILDSWFREFDNYQYPQNADENTGHYTQIVWADTMYVGCGYVHFRGNTDPQRPYEKLYVCFYGPSGNIANQAPYRTF